MNIHEFFQSSEDDIKTKIVATWLADRGFSPNDISVERSFELRLGRQILRVNSENSKKTSSQIFRPRADILVRNSEGKNLLIVEVKAPDEPLDDNVKEQAICYARLLRKGGIAPFVVLTNGHKTKIFDSISEELISDTVIPLDHPHVKAGFRVSGDDITIRAEALETFISLSQDNLIEFCRQQVAYRMRLLRDEDPHSDKKYIPSLYIERKQAKEQLGFLLDKKKQRVVIVIGPPQVGKTNFICHTIEERLKQGLPCLFYPAIGMKKGLLGEICDDFEWLLGDETFAYNIIHRKLQRILSRTGQKLTIFIDGWNEANTTLASTIDRESERLACYDIACVISMTNIAASRLLTDEAGNPSHVAEAAGIAASAIQLLEISPEKDRDHWSKVFIGKYNSQEVKKAYQKYTKIFNVQVSSRHQAVEDPFLLRIGMELYRGQTLPDMLDEPQLLKESIIKKAKRAGDLKEKNIQTLLFELADEMLLKDTHPHQSVVMKRWGLPTIDEPPKGLFEAALLAKICDEHGFPSLDFYYGRERDFVIAGWTRNWPNKLLEGQGSIVSELSFIARTQIGIDALRWFLKQPKFEKQLQMAVKYFSLYESPLIRRTLLSSLLKTVSFHNLKSDDWILKVINQGIADSDTLVKAEAAKLILALDEDAKVLINLLEDDKSPTNDLEHLLVNLLAIEESYPFEFEQDSVSSIALDAIRELHWQFGFDGEESEITDLLIYLMRQNSSNMRVSAAKALGYLSPQLLLRKLANQIKAREIDEDKKRDYIGGIEIAIDELRDMYYGRPMCSGYLVVLEEDKEELLKEYLKMYKICIPVISFYSSKTFSQNLLNILLSLQPNQALLDGEKIPDTDEVIAQKNALRYQLPLPFDLT